MQLDVKLLLAFSIVWIDSNKNLLNILAGRRYSTLVLLFFGFRKGHKIPNFVHNW